MTLRRIASSFMIAFARLLDSAERDAVLGDFAESGETPLHALAGVLGLLVRRQFALWADWRPWLALLGISTAAGMMFSETAFRVNVSLTQQLRTYWPYGVHSENGLTPEQNIICLACASLALLTWSWINGFVLGSLSSRTVWLTGAVFYLVVLNSFPVRLVTTGAVRLRNPIPIWSFLIPHLLLPYSIPIVLSLGVALWGVDQGLRRRTLPVRSTLLIAAAAFIVTVLVVWTGTWVDVAREAWSGGLWREQPWTTRLLPLLAMNWPAGYLLLTATRRPGSLRA